MNQIRIPKSFQLFAQTIKVEFDPDLVFDSDARGVAAYRENLIKILSKDNEKRPDEQIEKSFYHELVHWILHLMSEDELSDNEKFVDTFALLLHQFHKTAEYDPVYYVKPGTFTEEELSKFKPGSIIEMKD